MKKVKKKQKPRDRKAVRQEGAMIQNFVMSHIVAGAGAPLQEIHTAYQKWLKKLKLGESKLSVDSFGRLFPKNFERISVYREGKQFRGVAGIEVRHG